MRLCAVPLVLGGALMTAATLTRSAHVSSLSSVAHSSSSPDSPRTVAALSASEPRVTKLDARGRMSDVFDQITKTVQQSSMPATSTPPVFNPEITPREFLTAGLRGHTSKPTPDGFTPRILEGKLVYVPPFEFQSGPNSRAVRRNLRALKLTAKQLAELKMIENRERMWQSKHADPEAYRRANKEKAERQRTLNREERAKPQSLEGIQPKIQGKRRDLSNLTWEERRTVHREDQRIINREQKLKRRMKDTERSSSLAQTSTAVTRPAKRRKDHASSASDASTLARQASPVRVPVDSAIHSSEAVPSAAPRSTGSSGPTTPGEPFSKITAIEPSRNPTAPASIPPWIQVDDPIISPTHSPTHSPAHDTSHTPPWSPMYDDTLW